MNALLFDIGGTNMRFALTRDGRRFGKPQVVPTVKSFEPGMQVITNVGASLAGGRRITHIIGGVPGKLNTAKTTLLGCRHIPSWVGKNITRRLQQLTGARMSLENDSALVALGEATHGAGMRQDIVAYIGIGTGIGGARIVHGKIDFHRGSFEPGHQLVDIHRTQVEWEHLVSGSAIHRRYRRAPGTIHDRVFWRRQARLVAFGVVNVAMVWSPDIVVIGGSMTKRWRVHVQDVRHDVAMLWPLHSSRIPRIAHGRLGDFGGLFGALALLGQTMKGGEHHGHV